MAAVVVVGIIGALAYFLFKGGGPSTAAEASTSAASGISVNPRIGAGGNVVYYAPVTINESFSQTTRQYTTTVSNVFKLLSVG